MSTSPAGRPTPEDIRSLLRGVIDPELGTDVVELGMFRKATIDDDVTADFSGVKVVVDSSSAQMLTGATLDFKDGLNEAGFSIDNPNAQRTCGCGSSFS